MKVRLAAEDDDEKAVRFLGVPPRPTGETAASKS
jgi:hypothetical protein